MHQNTVYFTHKVLYCSQWKCNDRLTDSNVHVHTCTCINLIISGTVGYFTVQV